MSTIASLNVYLNAESEGYAKGVQAAERETVRFMMQLDQQARTMGMTASEAKLYSLELRGVEKSLIDIARQTSWAVEAQRAQLAVEQSAQKLTQELSIQAATFGMTAAQAAVYRLQLQGASKEALDAARAQAALVDAQLASQNAMAGSGGGSALGNLKGLGTLAKGGGILIGVKLIGDALTKLNKGIEEAVHGTGEWYDRVAAIVKTIPVLNTLYDVGNSFGGAITGANQMLAIEEERTKVLQKQIDAVTELAKKRREDEEETRKEAQKAFEVGQEMTIQNDKARASAAQKEANERKKFAEERAKQEREIQERIRKAEGHRLEAAKRKELERLDGEESALKKQLEYLKKEEEKIPKEMKFADLTAATGGNKGVGAAVKAAMQIEFGRDASNAKAKIDEKQLEVQKKIEENTRRQKTLSAANFL